MATRPPQAAQPEPATNPAPAIPTIIPVQPERSQIESASIQSPGIASIKPTKPKQKPFSAVPQPQCGGPDFEGNSKQRAVHLIQIAQYLTTGNIDFTLNPHVVHVILQGSKDISRHQYHALRCHVNDFVDKQIKAGRQVTVQLDGERDRLRSLSKWKEFSSVNRSTTIYSTRTDVAHPSITNTSTELKSAIAELFELGDHADNIIQQEGMTCSTYVHTSVHCTTSPTSCRRRS